MFKILATRFPQQRSPMSLRKKVRQPHFQGDIFSEDIWRWRSNQAMPKHFAKISEHHTEVLFLQISQQASKHYRRRFCQKIRKKLQSISAKNWKIDKGSPFLKALRFWLSRQQRDDTLQHRCSSNHSHLRNSCENHGDADVQNAYYNGYRAASTITNVVVFTPDGAICFASINHPGTFHDSRASYGVYELVNDLNRTPNPFKLLGDSAFPSYTGKIVTLKRKKRYLQM